MGGVHLVATEQGLDPHGSLVPHVDLPLKVSHVVLSFCWLKIPVSCLLLDEFVSFCHNLCVIESISIKKGGNIIYSPSAFQRAIAHSVCT